MAVDLSIIAPNGSELPLASDPWTPGPFRVMSGTTGLGLPVQQASFTEAAGGGRRLDSVRTSGRQINLELGLFAEEDGNKLGPDGGPTLAHLNLNRIPDYDRLVNAGLVPNMIRDGSFERGNATTTATGGTVTVSTDWANGGTRSAKMVATAATSYFDLGRWIGLSPAVTEPGRVISAGATIHLPEVLAEVSNSSLRITVWAHDGTNVLAQAWSTPAPNSVGVHTLTTELELPVGTTGVALRASQMAVGTVYWDDFVLAERRLLPGPIGYFDSFTCPPEWEGFYPSQAISSTPLGNEFGVLTLAQSFNPDDPNKPHYDGEGLPVWAIPRMVGLDPADVMRALAGDTDVNPTMRWTVTGTDTEGQLAAVSPNTTGPGTEYTLLLFARAVNRDITVSPSIRGTRGTPVTLRQGVTQEIRFTAAAGTLGDAYTGLWVLDALPGDEIDFESCTVVEGPYSGPHFSGDTPSDPDPSPILRSAETRAYAWTGEPGWSISMVAVQRWAWINPDTPEDQRREVSNLLDTLGDAIAHVDGLPLPRLRVRLSDGTSRETEFVVVDGGTEGLTELGYEQTRVNLALECPDAWWTSVDPAAVTFTQKDDGTPFLPSVPNVYLQPSSAFGAVTIENPGAAPSWVDWELRGPLTRVTATRGDETWIYNAPLLAGEVVYIRKTPAGIEVVDGNGVSKYANLGDVPRFFLIQPGTNNISVTVAGTTSATSVSAKWKPRYRQVF